MATPYRKIWFKRERQTESLVKTHLNHTFREGQNGANGNFSQVLCRGRRFRGAASRILDDYPQIRGREERAIRGTTRLLSPRKNQGLGVCRLPVGSS